MYPTQDLEKSESVMNCCEDHWQVEKCSLSRRTDPPFPPPPAAANRVTPSPPPDPHPPVPPLSALLAKLRNQICHSQPTQPPLLQSHQKYVTQPLKLVKLGLAM